MTGKIDTSMCQSVAQSKTQSVHPKDKSQKYLRVMRPENDHPGIGHTVPLPDATRAIKASRPQKTKYKAKWRRNRRNKSLARASTGSVSSVDSDLSRSERQSRKGLLGVNLDVVDQLATAVVSPSQSDNPVSSQDVRRQLACIVKPESNPYRGSKQTQRKRSSTQRKAKRNATVRIKEFQFVPRSCTVQLGGTVTFKVFKDVEATFALDGITKELVQLKAGESYTHTFEELGVVRYTCTKQTSMVGRINIVAPTSPAAVQNLKGSVSQTVQHQPEAHSQTRSDEVRSSVMAAKSQRSRRKAWRSRKKKQSLSSEEGSTSGKHSTDAIDPDCFDVCAARKFLVSRWETATTFL